MKAVVCLKLFWILAVVSIQSAVLPSSAGLMLIGLGLFHSICFLPLGVIGASAGRMAAFVPAFGRQLQPCFISYMSLLPLAILLTPMSHVKSVPCSLKYSVSMLCVFESPSTSSLDYHRDFVQEERVSLPRLLVIFYGILSRDILQESNGKFLCALRVDSCILSQVKVVVLL